MRKGLTIILAVVMLLSCMMAAAPAAGAEQEVVELIWFMGADVGLAPKDQAAVEAAMNEISEKELGIRLRSVYMDNEQALLNLSAGEYFDMAFTCEWYNDYNMQAINGYFMDLTDLLPTVPGLTALIPDLLWDGLKIEGKIYGIPALKDYAAEMYFRFDMNFFMDGENDDGTPGLGLAIPDTMVFEDVEEYLKLYKDAYPDKYPLMFNDAGFNGLESNYDYINRSAMIAIPYSAVGTDAEDTIVCSLEHEDLVKRFQTLHNWFNNGYINPDAAATRDLYQYSAVKTGQGFYGADIIWSSGDNYPQHIAKFQGPYLSNSSIRGSLNAVSAGTKYPEKVMQFFEYLYTHQDYADMLRYGVPGKHFNYNEDGTASKTQLGVDNYKIWAFAQGTYALTTVEYASVLGMETDPNMWGVIFDGYKDLVATHTLGFSLNTEAIDLELSACNAAKEKYWKGLITGTSNPDTELPKLISEMEASGLREVLAEAQRQYDAFLASN